MGFVSPDGSPQKKKHRFNKRTKPTSTRETSKSTTPKSQASARSLVPRKKRRTKQTRAPHPTPAQAPSANREKGAFECFPGLPIELRYRIWNLFRPGPRTVVINEAKNPKPKPRGGKAATYYLDTILFAISTVPPILHVCRESRQLGLETYRPLLTSLLRGMPTYFDWSQDTVHFADVNIIEGCFWHPKLEVYSKKWEKLAEETKEFKQNIRFISATGWVWNTSYSIELRSMRALKTLFLEEQNRFHFERQALVERQQYRNDYNHAWNSIFNEVIYLSERDMDKKVSDGTVIFDILVLNNYRQY